MTALSLVLATVWSTLLLVEAQIPGYPLNLQPVPVNPGGPIQPVPINPYPVSTGQSFNKCSPAVVQAIVRNFWNPYGVPRNLINTYMSYEKENIVATSPEYYPDHPVCVYSYFSQHYLNVFKVSRNGFRSSQSINIIEVDGSLYNPDTEVLRMHMMIYRGVSLVYTCSLANNAVVGPPQGLIKVREGNSDLNFAYYQAHQLMQGIGIRLTVEYPPIC